MTNLSTHEVRCVEGDQDFYGRVVGGDGTVGPEMLLATLHVDDHGLMLDAFERSVTLKDGEVLEYRLRALHADGHWVLASCRATPVERDDKGLVRFLRVEVEMTDLDCGQPLAGLDFSQSHGSWLLV